MLLVRVHANLFVGLITFLGDKFKVISKVFVKKAIGTMDFAGYFLVLWCGLDISNFHSLSYVGLSIHQDNMSV